MGTSNGYFIDENTCWLSGVWDMEVSRVGLTRRKKSGENTFGLQGEMLSSSTHSSQWGSGSSLSSLLGGILLTVIITATTY